MTLQLNEKWQRQEIGNLSGYPRLASSNAFGIAKKIMAKYVGMAHVNGQVFLGYCTIHREYYLDLIHMNDVIRCPICDKKWLDERKGV